MIGAGGIPKAVCLEHQRIKLRRALHGDPEATAAAGAGAQRDASDRLNLQ